MMSFIFLSIHCEHDFTNFECHLHFYHNIMTFLTMKVMIITIISSVAYFEKKRVSEGDLLEIKLQEIFQLG